MVGVVVVIVLDELVVARFVGLALAVTIVGYGGKFRAEQIGLGLVCVLAVDVGAVMVLAVMIGLAAIVVVVVFIAVTEIAVVLELEGVVLAVVLEAGMRASEVILMAEVLSAAWIPV